MSFQAYLDNIKAQTGKTPDDFTALAKQKGFLQPGIKASEIVTWLKTDFGLGHGHAMAIVLVLKQATGARPGADRRIDRLFSRSKATWRGTYDRLVKKAMSFGDDVHPAPSDTYISLLKGEKKFAVIGATAERLDIGLKLKGIAPRGRLEAAGSWNSMVTHRVQITDPQQVDHELLTWLKNAYQAA